MSKSKNTFNLVSDGGQAKRRCSAYKTTLTNGGRRPKTRVKKKKKENEVHKGELGTRDLLRFRQNLFGANERILLSR